jgi:hypothetical protein
MKTFSQICRFLISAALLLCACHPGHYNKLKKAESPAIASPQPLFGDNFNSFLFKTNLRVYGKDFSGLLVTKQLSPGDYRVIFTTELGLKLFDFEFRDTSFTLHYCVPSFNRPKLLALIQNDIAVLLMNEKAASYIPLTGAEIQGMVFRLDKGERQNYYFTDAAAVVTRIEQAKKRSKKVIFTLSDRKDNFPGHIVVQHYDAKLRIELNLLKK